MTASFHKTTFKTGDIIIKWYSTTNTLQTKGSGLPLCKQNWPVYSAKDELLALQTSSDYMSSVDVNLMTAFLVPVVRRLISANPGEKSESVFFCSNAFSLFLEHQKVDLLTITGTLSFFWSFHIWIPNFAKPWVILTKPWTTRPSCGKF